ncbi:hypothetical protein BBI17_003750 [Phytophthora kernoviae]|uniref:P-type ATPase A domain-containing protein n=1 Tax=Phytophthora kernoviae TaxID=325452 RepID=A0A421F7P1_9STRA|nr:hypothetical protein BBI17_003750 [Phytophthora kernoviae]
MKSLQEHLVVSIDESASLRSQLVHAPNEPQQLLPFTFSYTRLALYCVLAVCSCTILVIVSVWFPQVFTRIARKRLPSSSVGKADYVLILVHGEGIRAQWVECPVHQPASSNSDERVKVPWVWFEFKKHRYVYSFERGEFEHYLATICENLNHIRGRTADGLDEHTVTSKTELFGSNRVVIDKPHILMLIFVKLVHPFYLFQLFSAGVWFWEEYTIYAIVIIVLSAASMSYEIYAEVSNSNRLRALVDSDRLVDVLRSSKITRIHETELVPGDIILVNEGPMCADVLLLSGACTADEASLTGEALPVNKEPAIGTGQLTEVSARSDYSSSFLHAGSTITRARDGSKGVVLSTGFSTGKGELFRSILFPKPIVFEFERDSYRYLAVLSAIAIAAFLKRIVEGSTVGTPLGTTIVNSLDLITVAVPPALPLVLSSGIGFAMQRLQKGGIFCIDSQRINSCGQLSCFCFDKTGTLTQEHLSFAGVDAPSSLAQPTSPNTALKETMDIPPRFRLAMATCHGLSEHDGNLQGYSLDMAMFDASKFTLRYLHEKSKGGYIATVSAADNESSTFGIVKRFAFDATCQRSSAVVEEIVTKKRFVFVKGSPEAVGAISTSTPPDLKYKTLSYSTDGYYCIGFGVKELDPNGPPMDVNNRAEVESAVEFEGLALFKNELKSETKGMLDELYMADIDVRIITGDNALTAVHVCRELEMKMKSKVAVVDVDEQTGNAVYVSVDDVKTSDTIHWESFNASNMEQILAEFDLAITGAALGKLQRECGDETVRRIICQTPVFARVRPQQKAWIVEQLIELGLVVGMCGDGTNDCGALKAAHVGLALSSAEASIVAPFTSKAKAILDVPVLIREGRCALTTSFLGFKYMVLYPIIQLGMASVLAQVGTSAEVDIQLTDNQYLWDDLGIVLVVAMCMLYTGPCTKLSKERPPKTLFSLPIVASILGQIAIYCAFYAAAFALMANQNSWYCTIMDALAFVNENDTSVSENCAIFVDYGLDDPDDLEYSYEDTVTWLFAHLAYLAVAAAFNMKDPFRQPFWTNRIFTSVMVLEMGINLWFLLDNSGSLENEFQVMPMPSSFRWILFGLFVAELVIALGWEMIATRTLPRWWRNRTGEVTKTLREHLLVPVDDLADQRTQLVYIHNEPLRMLPYAFSLFTRLARVSLPYSSLSEADCMLILVHGDGVRAEWAECRVHHVTATGADYLTKVPWVWFEFKKHHYVYDYERGEFRRYLATIREDLVKLRARSNVGLDEHTANVRRELYGTNRIAIDKPKALMLLFVKLVHPFYLFQTFSMVVWVFKDYVKYAAVIMAMSTASMSYKIYAEVSNSNRLRALVDSDRLVDVLRSSKITRIHETELVPGDIILVNEGPMCADVLLLSGACTADEASLTGEALPVNKEPAIGTGQLTEVSARSDYSSSFLHAGSTITRARDGSKGVVLSTGFSTGKGELFRSILFPKPIVFEFERDSYRYLAVLSAIAIAAFLKRIVEGSTVGTPLGTTIVNSLDLITVAVPPALPLVLSSGIGFAMQRLQKGGIFCIDSQRINSCGQLSCFCFDKTGTLTQEHLSFAGVDAPSSLAQPTSPNTALKETMDIPPRFRLAMATCHGLSEHDGNLQGYSLDMAMFDASKFTLRYLHEKSKGGYIATVSAADNESSTFGIVKRFAFDATCQRSSAVVEEIVTKKRFVFVKGSPEAVSAISTSTPPDLKYKTLSYSTDGYYCIGFGVKELDPNGPPMDVNNRAEVESAVEFEGLALFKNELKSETKGMLDELYMADIDVRIITGDNALTAVHVCRELEMKMKSKVAVVDVDEQTGNAVYVSVDDVKTSDTIHWESFNASNMEQILAEFDLAITGAALGKLQRECGDETVRRIICQTPVFARVRPQQKAWIVEQLIELGLVVGMCGDGTNDCGALKAAHVGLALSSAEASIVAPFTSKAKAILDVPVLIREGRCALTTSFLGFKYMVLYPIIQLGMASVLAQVGTSAEVDIQLTETQYFWDDLTLVLALAISMLVGGEVRTK